MYPTGVDQELCVTWRVPGAAQKAVFCMQLHVNFVCFGVPIIPLQKISSSIKLCTMQTSPFLLEFPSTGFSKKTSWTPLWLHEANQCDWQLPLPRFVLVRSSVHSAPGLRGAVQSNVTPCEVILALLYSPIKLW